MTREELEHLIAAAANVLGENDFVVIGGQSVLGSHPDAPADLLRSMEADIYPLADPDQDKLDQIDGAIGEGTRFHQAYGFYAQGVGPETLVAPAGWQQRLVRVDIPPRLGSKNRPVAYCLEIHDLVVAKCAAERDRDFDYAEVALKEGLVEMRTLLARVDGLPVSDERRAYIREVLSGRT